MKLTKQEQKIVAFLSDKNDAVHWEELAQFAIDPANVKLRTIQKTVSEIRRKYSTDNIPIPFSNNFMHLAKEQNLVQVKRTPEGNALVVRDIKPAAKIDFILDRNTKSVRTKWGIYKLGDDEWVMLSYFDSNIGRAIKLSELRDVKYPNYGSKLPPRWFSSIQRTIHNIRRTIPSLQNRLLTTRLDNETSYLYQ